MSNFVFPGWHITRLIGRGNFGAVYEIERKLFEDDEGLEKAALKVISIPQNNGDIEEMINDGFDEESITSIFLSQRDSIVAEYTVMRKMMGCPNIVNLDDIRCVQHEDGIGWDICIKMELLTPLIKALPACYSEETVIKIAKDLCAALIVYEKFNVLHRDIKPQNIFLSAGGDYKLGELSITPILDQTMLGPVIGVYKFMAPEIYNSQPYDKRADIYSLGLVLYWLLNERRMPFTPLPPQRSLTAMDSQARFRRLSGEPLPMPAHGRALLKEIVLKACAYNPKDRYQSAQEMLDALVNQETLQEARVQMERKIYWRSGCFDKIDLVYNKAEEQEISARILSDLETGALAEARAHSSMIQIQGCPITPEQYDKLPDSIREQLIAELSNVGLASFSTSLSTSKITVCLSPQIQQVSCCAALSILNRLEELDGTFNMPDPQVTFEIQIPFAGKQEFAQIERLISLLYPWLKVTEVSSAEVIPHYKPFQTNISEEETAKSKPRLRVVLIGILVIVIAALLFNSWLSPGDPPIEFSQTVKRGSDVYVDIVSIVPNFSISLNGRPHGIVCRCTTANDETVWIYMLIVDYIEYFDPAADFSAYLPNFEKLLFSSERRVYGHSSEADDICRGLSHMTGCEMVIRFSSDDEEKFNQNQE